MCDVDEKKIALGRYDPGPRDLPAGEWPASVPVVHFRAAQPPILICIKHDLTGGAFEENLASMKLQEGRDYIHFS